MARNGLIFVVVTLIPAALLPAGAALGDDTGFYVGGSLGESSERFDPSLYRLRADTVGYQIAAGWRPVHDTLSGLTAMVHAAAPRKSGTASRSTR